MGVLSARLCFVPLTITKGGPGISPGTMRRAVVAGTGFEPATFGL